MWKKAAWKFGDIKKILPDQALGDYVVEAWSGVVVGGVKSIQDEGLRFGRWWLGIFMRGSWAKNPIFEQGFKWV